MSVFDSTTLPSSPADDEGHGGENKAARHNDEGEPAASSFVPDAAARDEGADARVSDAEPEPRCDEIRPGAIEKLVVPREDICADIELSDELTSDDAKMKIRRPNRREWFVLRRSDELPTRLLFHKSDPEGIDEQAFFVAPKLRGPVRDELKDVRVFQYMSVRTQSLGLWVVKVTLENSWYESVQQLLTLPPTFLDEHEFRIASDKKNSRYRIFTRKRTHEVQWPTTSTQELLGEALGADNFITSADHPVYRDLVDGEELS